MHCVVITTSRVVKLLSHANDHLVCRYQLVFANDANSNDGGVHHLGFPTCCWKIVDLERQLHSHSQRNTELVRHTCGCLELEVKAFPPSVPIFVISRYKQIQYRSLCLAAVWLVVICKPAHTQKEMHNSTMKKCKELSVRSVGSFVPCCLVCVVAVCGLCNVYTTSQVTLLAMSSGAFLIPALVLQLFCSLSILRVLRRPGPGEPVAQERKEGNRQKIRAMKIICTTMVTLAVNMIPFSSVPLVYSTDMLTFAFTLATAGSWVQGLLFLSRSGKVPKMLNVQSSN